MFEHIIQMGPMLVLAGLIAAWLAEAITGGDGHGFVRDMVLGLVGSLVVGATVWLVVSGHAGMLAMFFVGGAGAAAAILMQRAFFRSIQFPR